MKYLYTKNNLERGIDFDPELVFEKILETGNNELLGLFARNALPVATGIHRNAIKNLRALEKKKDAEAQLPLVVAMIDKLACAIINQ